MKARHRLSVKERRVIKAFLARLSERYGRSLQKVILYGSRARGDATDESDYDLLVVLSQVDNFWRTLDELGDIADEMLPEEIAEVSAVPVDEIQLEKRRYSPFFMNVAREGVLVYER